MTTTDTDTAPTVVLRLTDDVRLDDVRLLAARNGSGPDLYTVRLAGHGDNVAAIVATQAQLTHLRDALDLAIGRARTITKQRSHR